jgi:hypothetical protein
MPPPNIYRQLARQRVEAAWTCVGVLCPNLTLRAKKVLAQRVLDMCRGEECTPLRIEITPAQIQSIVWQHLQCINPHCPMVLFSREIADELNEFFRQEI